MAHGWDERRPFWPARYLLTASLLSSKVRCSIEWRRSRLSRLAKATGRSGNEWQTTLRYPSEPNSDELIQRADVHSRAADRAGDRSAATAIRTRGTADATFAVALGANVVARACRSGCRFIAGSLALDCRPASETSGAILRFAGWGPCSAWCDSVSLHRQRLAGEEVAGGCRFLAPWRNFCRRENVGTS
jgi:hypothetical protein